jgi:glucuronokinase
MVAPVQAQAYARAGLLGNPSDVYEGKAIAFTIGDFAARVRIEPAERFSIARGPAESLEAGSFRDAAQSLRERGCYDGIRLLRAAVKRFADRAEPVLELARDDPRQRFSLRYETDVPRQAGLGGSSAIVIAALRALARWFAVPIPPHEMAELALAAEVEDLGITAGPMDRVVQSYGGLLLMDFAPPRTERSYRRLDPGLLPPLFLAWDPRVGIASGVAHGEVRRRWLAGDTEVREAMRVFPGLVDRGVRCLEAGDHEGFRRLLDENFETRAKIFPIGARDREMVEIGRRLGAPVKLCGSGGAVVGALAAEPDFAAVAHAYAGAGYRTLRPRIAAASDAPAPSPAR